MTKANPFHVGDNVVRIGKHLPPKNREAQVRSVFTSIAGELLYVLEAGTGYMGSNMVICTEADFQAKPDGWWPYGKKLFLMLPMELRQRWWEETNYGEKQPPEELMKEALDYLHIHAPAEDLPGDE